MTAIFEVFYQPGKLFESLKDRRGAWILPLLLDVALLVAIGMVTIHFIGMENIMRQRLEGTRLTPEQMQTALSRADSPAQTYAAGAGGAVAGTLGLLAIAGALAVFAMMSDRQPRFSTMFSMVTLAYLPYSVVVCLMTTLVMIASPDPTTLDISNLLATNAGAFLDKANTAKWLYSLATSIDVLSFAEIGLLAYGFSKITRSGLSSGLFAVVSLWLLYVFAKTVLTSLF